MIINYAAIFYIWYHKHKQSKRKVDKLDFTKIKNIKKIFFNVCLFLRESERQSMSGGGAEREGDTESEAGSRLWAVSTEPDAGLEPTNCEIMTWVEVGRSTDWATQVPLACDYFCTTLHIYWNPLELYTYNLQMLQYINYTSIGC